MSAQTEMIQLGHRKRKTGADEGKQDNRELLILRKRSKSRKSGVHSSQAVMHSGTAIQPVLKAEMEEGHIGPPTYTC